MAERVTAELKVISVKVWYEIKGKNDRRGIFFDRVFPIQSKDTQAVWFP